MTMVVLLHGWGMNAAVFDAFSARLAPRHTVRALDLPGYGETPACEPYTLERLAAAVAAEAPERCCVVGWSLGAQVALCWAHAQPQQVERLALLAATPCFVQREDWQAAIDIAVLQAFTDALADDTQGTLRRFISLQARGDDAAKHVTRHLRDALSARAVPDAHVLGQGLRILSSSDLRDVLKSIGQPTLVVQGEHDSLVPLAAAEHLAHALPSSTLEVVPGAAHAPFVSRAAHVSRLIAEFFDER